MPRRCPLVPAVFLGAALLALTCAFTLLDTPSARAITRPDVLARGQAWVDAPVAYSQKKRHAGYRTDCSGYVSACWKTGTSWSTSSFSAVTRRISAAQLKPGDALLKKGYHIRLFYGWTDDTHTQYVAYEAGSSKVAVCRIHSIAEDLAFGYVPVRYKKIGDGEQPANALQNGSFDVWPSSWGIAGGKPVWWQTSGAWWQPVVARRTDVVDSSRSSLALGNPSSSRKNTTELSQSAAVVPGIKYRLSAWAQSPSDPRGITLRLTYLNAAGQSITQTETTGDRAGVDGATWRPMAIESQAPTDAVRAVVAIRLAGGTTTDTAGVATDGTSVTLDDIELARPRVSVGIKADRTSARIGRTVNLAGPVAPSSSAGAPATLYVQKPGGGWKVASRTPVVASGDANSWRGAFRFKRGMLKGTYRFKAVVSGVPGYLDASTAVVSVRLR